MDTKTHWEKVYTTKAPDAVSWYRPHLETSLALIVRAADARSASIIDIGGGESTLVDDLLAWGRRKDPLARRRYHGSRARAGSLRRVARPSGVSFSYCERAARRLCSQRRPCRQAGRPRNCQYIRARGSY